MGKLMEAIHYDVAITPDTPKSLLRDVMNLIRQKHYPKRFPAFDGRKNLYSPTKLPFGPTDSMSDTVTVDGENRPREFKVEIKFARMVDLSPLHDMLRTKKSPQDALQCLDIVLRNAPSNTCITAGRCFFTPPVNQIIQLGDGMEMYYGFYQSAIRGWKPLLNVDVAHKAFPTAQGVLDVICELGSNFRSTMQRDDLKRPINDYLQKDLEKFLRQLKVKYEITGQSGSKRIQRVNGLGAAPSQATFKLEDGKITTVEKYYRDVKKVPLKYPHLPTLWVGARDRDSKILLPLEFCTVVGGQAVNRKMNENQTSAMIKKSATSTEVRKQKIMDSLNKAKYNNDPCIREFGFSVNNQFEILDARVLQPPNLLYNDNLRVTPSKGIWRADRSRFLIGAEVRKWTITCVTRQPCKPEQLADTIFKMGNSNGMRMPKATPPFVPVGGRQTVRDIIDFFKTKQDFDLIFVIVPNSGPQYSFVKQAAELNVGCLTQCIKERTFYKMNPQTAMNILLKVNSKMNGTNHTFHQDSRPPILARPCMIMGADVTHPSPDAKDIPSVAAVTASHDPKAFQYNICWRLQPPKMEIIEDLCNITVEQLKFFYSKTKVKPETIIFFRDGVSEGQFDEVHKAEISAIQRACKIVQADGYEPKITFLVVQKRHHTRLFPTNPRDSEDRNLNVPAGTCVDTTITNPTMQDFYLVSHASIQGVAKPTKYCTLWDDNNMNNDTIEELTYHLCHMFTRCNRSVSYPAPTYYAHLAAARAKVYIENDKLNLDELKKCQDKYQIKECICKGKPMFFV
jgi:eukaryotic translation initiation factor 2C